MIKSNRGADVYRRMEAETRSPMELVVMLYDGAIRFTLEARDAAARRDVGARGTAVSRALAIVGELHSTLNIREGGDIARELDRLYAYMTSRLLDVTAKGDESALDEIHKLLCTLREGWSQIAAGVPSAAR